MIITRHFIRIGDRTVHYRKAGTGPILLMIHQSPRSSAEYVPLMEKWSAHFTCIAPDTPGFGQSDPLPGNPDIADFAQAVHDLLDALGIDRCAAYGFHSGAIILMTAIKRQPARFTRVAMGGYAVWTPEEMALFGDAYLPPFHPSGYGEHLTWLWNRILEQSWFFPWFATDGEHRLTVAHADPARVDAVVREMLDAGNAYQAGYGAVLRAPRDIPPPGAAMPPCLITAYDGDPLQEHIDRLGEMPADWEARKVATPDEHQQASLDQLLAGDHLGAPVLPEAADEGFVAIKAGRFDGLIHWRGNRDTDRLHLHEPGRALPADAPSGTLHIDLPGHGLSDDWTGDAPENWTGWAIVLDAIAAHFGTAHTLIPSAPPGDPARLYPGLTPDRFGVYLTTAWQVVRARHFFEPWYEANASHTRAFTPDTLTPERLAVEHLDLLRGRAAKAWHYALLNKDN
ncbi:MAG: alpha/beta fold hydrolase [Pseudomonadota bacterium]